MSNINRWDKQFCRFSKWGLCVLALIPVFDVIDISAAPSQDYSRVVRLIENHHYHAALLQIDSLLSLDTADLTLTEFKGICYLNTGRPEAALDVFRQVLAVDPDNLDVLLKAGAAALLTGDYPTALNWFERAAAIEDTNAMALLGIGIAASHEHQFDKARVALERLTGIVDTIDEAHLYLGQIYMHQGLDSLAIHHLKRYVAAGGNHPMAYYNLGVVLIRHGQGHAALNYLRKIPPDGSRSLPELPLLLGRAYFLAGSYDSSLLYLAEAMKSDQLRAESMYWYGRSLWETGRKAEAVNTWQSLGKEFPGKIGTGTLWLYRLVYVIDRYWIYLLALVFLLFVLMMAKRRNTGKAGH